ncbi:hypothetical protein DFH06DRAFT_462469 [Mycena polygramma]|nr:hypothetical protein DFH06DRAFT_462469 [Mycena polygramma]
MAPKSLGATHEKDLNLTKRCQGVVDPTVKGWYPMRLYPVKNSSSCVLRVDGHRCMPTGGGIWPVLYGCVLPNVGSGRKKSARAGELASHPHPALFTFPSRAHFEVAQESACSRVVRVPATKVLPCPKSKVCLRWPSPTSLFPAIELRGAVGRIQRSSGAFSRSRVMAATHSLSSHTGCVHSIPSSRADTIPSLPCTPPLGYPPAQSQERTTTTHPCSSPRCTSAQNAAQTRTSCAGRFRRASRCASALSCNADAPYRHPHPP